MKIYVSVMMKSCLFMHIKKVIMRPSLLYDEMLPVTFASLVSTSLKIEYTLVHPGFVYMKCSRTS